MRNFSFLILLLLFFNSIQRLSADHLLGGELSYECLGGDDIRITLTLYRNCNSINQNLDDASNIFVTNVSGGYISPGFNGDFLIIPRISIVDVLPDDSDICAGTAPDFCVQRITYRDVVEIDPVTNGFYLLYQRCCRPSDIINITNPGGTGSTYSVFVPHYPSEDCNNSSPVFNEIPPIIVCAGYTQYFNYSATDADGDSLVYTLCPPFGGGNDSDCVIPGTDCNFPININEVIWIGNYDVANQIGGSPALTVNPVTGLVTCHPDSPGKYVTAICVEEWRDGNLISVSKRDFTFVVTLCDIVSAIPSSDAIFISEGIYMLDGCDEYIVNFDNVSIGADTYYWDFGDLTTTDDFSTEVDPFYIYPDTGIYEITLIANPNQNCRDTATLILNLYPGFFNTSFSYSNANCSGESISFTSTTSIQFGIIEEWHWDFGDGTTSTEENPVHIFEGAGPFLVSLTNESNLGCEGSWSELLSLNIGAEATISRSVSCPGEPITFTATPINGSNISSYNWVFTNAASTSNTTTSIATATFTTDYAFYDVLLTITSANGCESVIPYSFFIYTDFDVDAGQDIDICIGETTEITASVLNPSPVISYDYLWTPAAGLDSINSASPLFSGTASTLYTVTATDPNGCIKTDDIAINVRPLPTISLPDEATICEGESIMLDPQSTGTAAIFEWSPAEGLDNSSSPTPSATPEDTITYHLTATNTFGCIAEDSIRILVQPFIAPPPLLDGTICQGDSLLLTVSGGLYYEWQPSTGLSHPDSSTTWAYPSETTTYTVTIGNDCFDEAESLTISILDPPEVDAGAGGLINIGESINLNGNTNAATYSWTPPTGLSDTGILNPIATPQDNTTYYLTSIFDNGCENRDGVFIEVNKTFEIYVPTAFSPNADGLNDAFRLITRGIEDVQDFKIYNRWGQQVFAGKGLTAAWNGTHNGQDQEIGVYVYFIKATKLGGNGDYFKKGNITLIR